MGGGGKHASPYRLGAMARRVNPNGAATRLAAGPLPRGGNFVGSSSLVVGRTNNYRRPTNDDYALRRNSWRSSAAARRRKTRSETISVGIQSQHSQKSSNVHFSSQIESNRLNSS